MRLYVGNLDASVTEEDLRELFEEYGYVEDVYLITDRETGQSRGFAFVEMADDSEGDEAAEDLEFKDFKGRPIHVSVARSRDPRGGRRGHGGYRGF